MIDTLKTADEATLRDTRVATPDTIEELNQIITALVEREHDYGTCVYAMSIAAVATYNYVARKLGVTGFQASCADLDILKRTRRMEHGFRILDYGNLLYPQYGHDFDTLGFDALIEENAEWLATEARRLLVENENENGHPDVLAHWRRLAGEAE